MNQLFNRKNRRWVKHNVLPLLPLLLIAAIVAVVGASLYAAQASFHIPAFAEMGGITTGAMTLGAFGFMLRAPADGPEGGAAVLPEAQFQQKVLGGVAELKTSHETLKKEISTQVENWDKQNKKAIEDLEKLRGDNTTLVERLKGIELAQAAFKNEIRMAGGDPIKRLLGDAEKKNYIEAVVRSILKGQMDEVQTKRLGLAHKAIGEDSSPGSTLILDKDIAKEIYDTLPNYGIWSTFAVRRLGAKITKFPVKTARPVANWLTSEAATIPDDTNKAGTSVDCQVYPIAVLLNVSRQLLADAENDIAQDVLEDFLEAIALRLDYSALLGNGTADATNGGVTGIFPGGTASVSATGRTTTETQTVDDFIRILTVVDPVVLNRSAKWWLHPQILARALSIKDANGRPIFLTALEAPTFGGIMSLLGYGVVPSLAAPSANTVSSKLAVFGDPNAQVVGVRSDIELDASDHFRWNTFERSFRGIMRAGIKIRKSSAFGVLTTSAS